MFTTIGTLNTVMAGFAPSCVIHPCLLGKLRKKTSWKSLKVAPEAWLCGWWYLCDGVSVVVCNGCEDVWMCGWCCVCDVMCGDVVCVMLYMVMLCVMLCEMIPVFCLSIQQWILLSPFHWLLPLVPTRSISPTPLLSVYSTVDSAITFSLTTTSCPHKVNKSCTSVICLLSNGCCNWCCYHLSID